MRNASDCAIASPADIQVAVRTKGCRKHLHWSGAITWVRYYRATSSSISGALGTHQRFHVNGIHGSLPIVTGGNVMHPDHAVGGARLIRGIERMRGSVIRELQRYEAARLNKTDARTLDVVVEANARDARGCRVIDFRIDTAQAVAGIAIPHVAHRLAGELADGRAFQNHSGAGRGY